MYSKSKLKGGKLNQLERLLPEGLLVDAAWLDSPVRGVYWRPRGVVLST